MKGTKEIVELLNEVLAGELVAINQYFLHAKMCKNWGYLALAAHGKAESIDEMKHADAIIDRILYLDGKGAIRHHVGDLSSLLEAWAEEHAAAKPSA